MDSVAKHGMSGLRALGKWEGPDEGGRAVVQEVCPRVRECATDQGVEPLSARASTWGLKTLEMPM